MKPMGLRSRPIQWALKKRYWPLKVSLESVEVKSQFLQNLSRLIGQFIKGEHNKF